MPVTATVAFRTFHDAVAAAVPAGGRAVCLAVAIVRTVIAVLAQLACAVIVAASLRAGRMA